MTTGRLGLLERGHRRRIRRGSRTIQGLRAGRSSGRRSRIRWGRSTFWGQRAGRSYTLFTPDQQQLLLLYRAVGPADVQR